MSGPLALAGQEYLRKALNTSEATVSIVFLNFTATLLLHATLFLLKATTIGGPILQKVSGQVWCRPGVEDHRRIGGQSPG